MEQEHAAGAHLLGSSLEVQGGLLLVRVHTRGFADVLGAGLPAENEPVKHMVQACSTGSQLRVHFTAT